MLPDVPRGRVLFLGVPTAPELSAVLRTASDVVVILPNAERSMELQPDVGGRMERVRFIAEDPLAYSAESPFDLVVISHPDTGRALLRSRGVLATLDALVSPTGWALVLCRGRAAARRVDRMERAASAHGFQGHLTYWANFRREALRLAVPMGRPDIVRYFFDRVLYASSLRGRLLRQGGRLASRLSLVPRLSTGRALVLVRDREDSPGRVPRYLAALADAQGTQAARECSAFFARGDYDSNKVAFLLFPSPTAGDSARPGLIVKLTRSDEFNVRLDREHAALVELSSRRPVPRTSHPAPVFTGAHAGLTVVAQTIVAGDPFRLRTRATADCPFAAGAFEWIERLGVATARTEGHDSSDVVDRLRADVETLCEVFHVTKADVSCLRSAIERLASGPPTPSVFRHGDAGTWNAIVTEGDEVAFLDWEAADLRGMPLWDTFDFLRSFGAWIARRAGGGDRLENSLSGLLGDSGRIGAPVVRRYCEAVGVPRSAVPALFFGCWVERALREAEWTTGPLDDGQYINVLRHCIEASRNGRITCLPA